MKCLYYNSSIYSRHYYDHIIRWCLDDVLQCSNYNLKISFDVCIGCWGSFTSPNIIKIELCREEKSILLTLFHELRHYHQHRVSMFDFDHEKYNHGDIDVVKRPNIKSYREYLKLPWELDANKFATETYGDYLRFGREECMKHLWQGNYENYDNID